MNVDGRYATSEYFGCTVIVMVGRRNLTIAHMSEGSGKVCPLKNARDTDRYLNDNLLRRARHQDKDEACDDMYVIIAGSVKDSPDSGVPTLREFIMSYYGLPAGNVRYIYYEPGEPTAEWGSNNQALHPVRGRSFFRWAGYGTNGVMTVFLGHEEPRLVAYFNDDWTPSPGGPHFGLSTLTTDGNGNVQKA
ncbi:alpha-galactosidase [Purpureocillium lavendulum]|uniref:Alpha-galactosidase n=1 Tax=Purpureocillium lavendulum TaxID=1247861 RepID=A0AB34G5A9_9HYPO|nr:alpha-galactosidase [Purpureocillium lavendulum]